MYPSPRPPQKAYSVTCHLSKEQTSSNFNHQEKNATDLVKEKKIFEKPDVKKRMLIS